MSLNISGSQNLNCKNRYHSNSIKTNRCDLLITWAGSLDEFNWCSCSFSVAFIYGDKLHP